METRLYTWGSDKTPSDNLWRSWGRSLKRDNTIRCKAKEGKELCEHCCWRAPTPSMLHAHHVVPRACGGSDTIDNLIVLCPNCHALAHYVTATSSMKRKYTGPDTPLGLRRWMACAKSPRKLKALQREHSLKSVAHILAAMRA